nr:VTT domain-containing protein [Bacilli bacterium]
LVYIVEMVSLPIFFLMSRRLGRGFVEQKLRGRLKQLDETIADTSFWSIFFLRFFIIIPFRFLDLFMGLTKISLRKYFFIALIGSPLRVFFLQYFLSLGMETIVDVNKFSAYMESHPFIAVAAIVYTAGAFVAIFVMKKMAARKRAGRSASNP